MSNDNNTGNNETQKKEFFDLHTTGIGYLNRARTVNPSQGDPYESVSIAALHGSTDKPSYSYFDTLIVGADANTFVKKHMDVINNRNCKVLVQFKVGDGVPTSYLVKSGNNEGKRNHLIKSRLLQITWAKINGDVVLEPPVLTGPDQLSADADQSQASDAEPESSKDQQIPATVKLDQNDPNFTSERADLEEFGYRLSGLDGDVQIWTISQAA